MKKILTALVCALVLTAGGQAQSMRAAAPAGALLSTNLSAAVMKLNTAMHIHSGSMLMCGRPPIRPIICPGGDCGTAPIVGLPPQGCTSSPENPTLLLGVLGLAGLVMGRAGYQRRQSRELAASVA